MAGMGPAPKDPRTRQRRNRVSTAATLPDERAAKQTRRRAPKLPSRHEWQPETLRWWREVWRSPMATQYLASDVHQLYILAELIDGYWVKPSHFRAAEIRQQCQNFGLTPLDRRRLQWEIPPPDAADEPPPLEVGEDPRRLFAVS